MALVAALVAASPRYFLAATRQEATVIAQAQGWTCHARGRWTDRGGRPVIYVSDPYRQLIGLKRDATVIYMSPEWGRWSMTLRQHLVRWVNETCRLRGYRIVKVDAHGREESG